MIKFLLKQKIIGLIIAGFAFLPGLASAQVSAKAYVIMDAETKQVVAAANSDLAWTPASLTKLVTALVVLDAKTKLTKSVAITKADQIAGGCGHGGSCVKAVPGVKFTVDGLFHAALMPSANNAANALARSTGLTPKQFAKKMNAKARSLGASNSNFNEPTGMDPRNVITASDYAKIVSAAFANQYLRTIAQQTSYVLVAANNSKYTQTIKNSDKLLDSEGLQMLGAKTGYLNESMYNFASVLKYNNGHQLVVVLLGEPHMYSAFDDTKYLAGLVSPKIDVALAGP
ncbi:MAG: serine hydrolase [Candidatus Doudnabacteria bacterium]